MRAARAAAARGRRPIFFYEDLDYVSTLGEAEILEFVHAWDPGLMPVYVPLASGLDRKLEQLGWYPSQLGEPEREAARRHALRWDEAMPMERLWSRALPCELARWLG
jgi:hypothetical protein